MFGMLFGGWAVGIYFIRIIFENLHTIFVVYQTYVFWYVIVTGFFSFVICYRMGPPQNQRSKDLIKWGLQLAANIMIFYSSSYHEASVCIMIVTICSYYFPVTIIHSIRRLWWVNLSLSVFFFYYFNRFSVNLHVRYETKIHSIKLNGKMNLFLSKSNIKNQHIFRIRRFPPKQRLLTSEEFHAQSVFETTKALDELKAYCSSPESKPWRMMSRLKDPQRSVL